MSPLIYKVFNLHLLINVRLNSPHTCHDKLLMVIIHIQALYFKYIKQNLTCVLFWNI
jgi:hypothetical protein